MSFDPKSTSVSPLGGSLAISDTVAHVVAAIGLLSKPSKNVGIHLDTSGSLVGAWAIKVSGDGNAWGDITTAFSPAFSAVAASPNAQFGQATPLFAANIEAVFTASSGTGTATAIFVVE